ncbi:MAG: low specificity L-threonine aldolase, partial [Pseudomonadota bacterium]
AYLTDDLWLRLAKQANAAAARLEAGIRALPGTSLVHPRGGNQLFAAWPRGGHLRAQAAGAQYYLWPMSQTLEGPAGEPVSARLVTNWSTGEAEIEAFLAAIAPDVAEGAAAS